MTDTRYARVVYRPVLHAWQIQQCPWCGARHRHGASATGDIRDSLGTRRAHCAGAPYGREVFLTTAVHLHGRPVPAAIVAAYRGAAIPTAALAAIEADA